MQLSTIAPDGRPNICHVWYNPSFSPDAIYFISREDRHHSANIRSRPGVAGAIIVNVPEGLGSKVQGVTFTGSAEELSLAYIGTALDSFLSRWPNARDAITLDKLNRAETQMRLYQIIVEQWILFDEVNFPGEPRRTIAGTS
jgi:uncharacterized protein YhbP (UPF0306 family)